MRSDDDIFHPSFIAIIFSLIPLYNLSLFIVGFTRFIFLVINIYKMKKAAKKHKDEETVSKLNDIINTFKELNN